MTKFSILEVQVSIVLVTQALDLNKKMTNPRRNLNGLSHSTRPYLTRAKAQALSSKIYEQKVRNSKLLRSWRQVRIIAATFKTFRNQKQQESGQVNFWMVSIFIKTREWASYPLWAIKRASHHPREPKKNIKNLKASRYSSPAFRSTTSPILESKILGRAPNT